jgi:peptidoglycan hydrolase-like protein with peptidoglycan-binding domain
MFTDIKRGLIAISVCLLALNIALGTIVYTNVGKIKKTSKAPTTALAQNEVLGVSTPVFSRHMVLSDEAFTSTRAFPNEGSVQAYLVKTNSPLKNYSTNGKSASYWIYSSARGVTSSRYGVTPQINPGVILAYLEKEQSLISLVNYDVNLDPQFRVRAAMGYGCPDDASCSETYKGFANQVNWAAYQLQYNFNQATTTGGGTNYIVGRTILTLDEYPVYITNAATAAQYRYTPHVYWGNYNLWKIVTANGWGQDATTYNMGEIDRINLPNKGNKKFDGELIQTITFDQVRNIVTQNIPLGTQNADITLLQNYLREQGYYSFNAITGFYGVVTEAALKEYRIDKGITTGYKNLSVELCSPHINRDWNMGESSIQVTYLQNCLIDLGLFNYPVATGYFGPLTKKGLDAAKKGLNLVLPQNPIPKPVENENCQSLKAKKWTIGQQDASVTALQNCLQKEGIYTWPLGITGYFGPYTQKLLNSNTTVPAPTPATESCQTLYANKWNIGDSGSRVSTLQTCLKSAGLYTWPQGITGYFGSYTRDSLTRKNGSTVSNNTCTSLKTQKWEFGERSNRVKALQECMRTGGVFNYKYGATGYFGLTTKESLVKWRGYF